MYMRRVFGEIFRYSLVHYADMRCLMRFYAFQGGGIACLQRHGATLCEIKI